MTTTDSIFITSNHLPYWERLQKVNDLHEFKILSTENTDQEDIIKLTFSYKIQFTKYLLSDIFYFGSACRLDTYKLNK